VIIVDERVEVLACRLRGLHRYKGTFRLQCFTGEEDLCTGCVAGPRECVFRRPCVPTVSDHNALLTDT